MDKKDIFKRVYEDFFGINSISKKNEKLAEEIENLNGTSISDENMPENSVNKQDKEKFAELQLEASKAKKDRYKAEFCLKIEELYIDEKSKELLYKIIDYMEKYDAQIEKQYISFDMCVYTDNDETLDKIIDILAKAGVIFSYIREGRAVIYSLYDVDDVSKIPDMYDVKNNVVVIKNFEALESKELIFKNRFMNKFDEVVNKNQTKVLTILNAKDNKQIDQDFYKMLDFEIQGIEPDVQDVYNEVLEKIKNSIQVTDDFEVKLLDYISSTYPKNTLPYPEYRDNLTDSILFYEKVPEYEKDKSMEEIFAELNSLVGLKKVKDMLKDLSNLIELKDKTKDSLKIKDVNLHMIFLGNPGTGKTTVARIVAEILYNLKYIKQNKLIEVSSKDLVAEYVGQTAPKTNAVIQKALGGVLFVDEAYSLASGGGQGNSYNEEAIATLIQGMENYRDELVVIFAGYTKEMQDFLNANSGIVSRIGYTVEFEDYTTDELIKIFEQMMKKSGFIVTDEAIQRVREIIDEYKGAKNFGNARFVRNIYEKSIIKHASNTKDTKNKKILKTIDKDDISAENLLKM